MLDFSLIKPQSSMDSAHQTALARRILALSLAFHERTMTDEQILFYADELMAVCLEQIEVFTRLKAEEGGATPARVLRYLEGMLHLTERFDHMSHIQVLREVGNLEERLTSAVLNHQHQEAA